MRKIPKKSNPKNYFIFPIKEIWTNKLKAGNSRNITTRPKESESKQKNFESKELLYIFNHRNFNEETRGRKFMKYNNPAEGVGVKAKKKIESEELLYIFNHRNLKKETRGRKFTKYYNSAKGVGVEASTNSGKNHLMKENHVYRSLVRSHDTFRKWTNLFSEGSKTGNVNNQILFFLSSNW